MRRGSTFRPLPDKRSRRVRDPRRSKDHHTPALERRRVALARESAMRLRTRDLFLAIAVALGSVPAPAQAQLPPPPPPPATLWSFLGIPQGYRSFRDNAFNRSGNRPNLERKP